MMRHNTIASAASAGQTESLAPVDREAGLAPNAAGMWSSRAEARPAPWSWVLVGAVLATLLAASLRLALLEAPPQFDELYHVLAAQGFLTTGTFAIGEGVYERAALYTRLVAETFELFGDSIAVGRLPALLAGSLLPAVVFVFVARVAGLVAATFAALFTVVWPEGIALSEVVRFYALHGLVFFLAAMALYRLLEEPVGWLEGTLLAAATVALLALAAHLQPTTFIGLAGLAAWAGLFVVLPAVWSLRRWRWPLLAAMALAGAAVLAVAVWAGWLAEAWRIFRWTPLWLADSRDYESYYHDAIFAQYPLLWPFTPLAVAIGLAVRPRPVLMATTVFAVGFVLHSVGGMKSYRYLSYLMPFLFMVWAIAIAAIISTAAGALARGGRSGSGRRLTAAAAGAVASLVVVLAIAANPAVPLAARMATSSEPPQPLPDMTLAQPALAEAVREADLVLTGSELHGLYYFGRADVLISASRQSEVAEGEEFVLDPRTGVPIVAAAQSVARLVDCSATGLFITPAWRWAPDNPLRAKFGEETMAALIPIELPEASKVVAYRWAHEPATGPDCAGLPGSGTPALPARS